MKYVFWAFLIGSLFACSKKFSLSEDSAARNVANAQGGAETPSGKITYMADFWDDMKRMYHWDAVHQKPEHSLTAAERSTANLVYLEPSAAKFDEYFKTFHDQGITRLIVYGSPLSFVLDNDELYCGQPSFPFPAGVPFVDCERWKHFKRLNQALLNSRELKEATDGTLARFAAVRQLLEYRNMTAMNGNSLSRLITEAAARNQVALTFEYRPFEQSGQKYYSIPVFNAGGAFHFRHSPFSSPEAELLKSDVGYPHIRKLLDDAGKGTFGQIGAIRLLLSTAGNVELRDLRDALSPNGDPEGMRKFYDAVRGKFAIVAAMHAPMDPDAFVLKQKGHYDFELAKVSSFEGKIEAQQYSLSDYDIVYNPSNATLLLRNIEVPSSYSHLIIKGRTVAAPGISLRSNQVSAVELWSKEGTRIGNNGVYWVYKNAKVDPAKTTLAAPIAADGSIRTEFFAAENSASLYRNLDGRVAKKELSSELATTVKENRLNTDTQVVVFRGEEYSDDLNDFTRPAALLMARRQTDLALRSGFRDLMIQIRSHTHYYGNVHDAYAPQSMLENPIFKGLLATPIGVQQLTAPVTPSRTRADTCQSDACDLKWRLARNQEMARAFEAILKETSDLYPQTRIQAVLPESASATAQIQEKVPGGFNRHIDGGWNYSALRFEGQAMAKLDGTHIEPVLLGLRTQLPENRTAAEVLPPFLNAVLADLPAKRMGFVGPTSVLYEAQDTLNGAGEPQRKLTLCALLAHSSRINEVILYEAGDYYAWRKTPTLYSYLPDCRQIWGAALGQ